LGEPVMAAWIDALRPKSMRARIAAALVASTLSIVLAFSLVAIVFLKQNLINAVDERLHHDYELVSLSFFWQDDNRLSVRDAQHFHLDGEDEQEARIEIRDESGRNVLFDFFR
jgi:hypothetical protein